MMSTIPSWYSNNKQQSASHNSNRIDRYFDEYKDTKLVQEQQSPSLNSNLIDGVDRSINNNEHIEYVGQSIVQQRNN